MAAVMEPGDYWDLHDYPQRERGSGDRDQPYTALRTYSNADFTDAELLSRGLVPTKIRRVKTEVRAKRYSDWPHPEHPDYDVMQDPHFYWLKSWEVRWQDSE